MGRGKPVIVLGDKTDHGGTVIEGDPTSTVAGKPIARLGDKVSCPKCKGTFPIIEGVVDTIYSDKPVAIHGHKTACGAMLIGSQTLLTVSTEPGNAKSAAESPSALAASQPPASKATQQVAATQQSGFDQRFQLFDELTGVPLAKQPYRLHGPSGPIEGITDEEGITSAINTGSAADEVHLEIIGEDWPRSV